MKYFEAPEYHPDARWEPSVFLGGGITDCPHWQAQVVEMLWNSEMTVLNPRRVAFPIHDPTAARVQIEWEYWHLFWAHIKLFWFPASPGPQPIALYELGAWRSYPYLFVGADPEYLRRADVEIQLHLERRFIGPQEGVPGGVFSDLEQLVESVKHYFTVADVTSWRPNDGHVHRDGAPPGPQA